MPDPVTPKRGIGAATEQAAASRPRRSWRELLRDFLRPSRGQAVLALSLMLTTLLVVWTVRSLGAQEDFSNLRREDLLQLLDTLSSETNRLESEVRDLQTTRDQLLSGAEGAEAAEEEARRRLDQLEIIAGTVPVYGRGIQLVIEDPEGKVTPELLLDGLEEMRDAGAEVIEFNDSIRVVASSWLGRDDQGRIVVDGEVLTTPILMEVIGDPATLEAGARFRGGLVSELESGRVGAAVEITQADRVEIESIVVPEDNEYARTGEG